MHNGYVKSLVDMVTKLFGEMNQLNFDNAALKLQKQGPQCELEGSSNSILSSIHHVVFRIT
jgi:hypothetical protein